MKTQFNKICIFGVGLIGGSLARAYKKANPNVTIVGIGRNETHLRKAQELGVIDSFDMDFSIALEDVDLLVFAMPVGAVGIAFESVKKHLNDSMILTDVGSTKANVVELASNILGKLVKNFVPGHPIAGTEKSGAESAFAELFELRRVILTPTEVTDSNATKRVSAVWEACGAEVIEMSTEHHDKVLAATSHLPHMLAFSLVDTLSKMNDKQEIFKYAAGGFRDFTRIASSSPEMWQDICLANSDALIEMISQFQSDLNNLTKAIKDTDKEEVLKIFNRAKNARDQFCNE